MYIQGLVYHLSHNCHFDIDRDVLTAHCRSSSGDSVDLLSRTICTTVLLVIGVSHSSLIVGGFSIQSIVGIVLG